MVWGSVRATTRAPAFDATVDASSWWAVSSVLPAVTASTFQLTGRPDRSEMRVSRSTSSSVKPLRQPGTIISIVVPGWSATAAANRSSSPMAAEREGTGWPVAVVVGRGPARWRSPWPPRPGPGGAPPPCRPAAPRWPRGPRHPRPSPTRRRVECPTRKPALTPTVAVQPGQPLAERTATSSPARPRGRPGACPRPGPACATGRRRGPGPAGASEKPQLPPTTVVTPCSGEGLAVGSQNSWAS